MGVFYSIIIGPNAFFNVIKKNPQTIKTKQRKQKTTSTDFGNLLNPCVKLCAFFF